MNFDEVIDRCDTHSKKWDMMESLHGVNKYTGIAMWIADMDFRPPDCIQDALRTYMDSGIYGYFGDLEDYHAAICWWMKTRHDWVVDPQWITAVHGLVNGAALCVDTYTQPGDGIVLFTPVYHAFARVINAAGRSITNCELVEENGRYAMDFAAYDKVMTGKERLIMLCSPHNPGGQVWTVEELSALAEFARRHDLIIVSDEIHHDLVFADFHHTPMAKIDGISERLVMMTAPTKTFNIAGSHTGNVIILDKTLRDAFELRLKALGLSPNSFGPVMTTAAYSPEGAVWVDALMDYLDGNRRLFDDSIGPLTGVRSMNLESTYLAWVDFSGTQLGREEVTRRVEKDAKIAISRGPGFGPGGEDHLRFNIALSRPVLTDAIERIQNAFSDL